MESTIPSLIGAAERGDGSAAEALFGALYAELHRLAKRTGSTRRSREPQRDNAPARGVPRHRR
jgi:hypothetical protein